MRQCRSIILKLVAWAVLLVGAHAQATADECADQFKEDPRHATLFRGDELRSSAWVRRPGNDTVFVMVHGIFSNNRDAWLNTDPTKNCPYWPDLIADEKDFEEAGVFVASYYTDFDSGNFDIPQAANVLYTLLTIPTNNELLAPIHSPKIVFIAHSMGGIVVKRMLEKKWSSFKDKKIGLVLVASPARGSGWADRASTVIELFQSEMGRQLQPDNPILEEIHKGFVTLRSGEGKEITGLELFENTFFKRKCPSFWSIGCALITNTIPPIVKPTDAGGYFGDGEILPNTDHSSIAKPGGDDALIHIRLRRFVREKLIPEASPRLAYPGALDVQGSTPKYGWRVTGVPNYKIELTAHPTDCAVTDAAGVTSCKRILGTVASSNPPKLGDRRWVSVSGPKIETRIGNAHKYEWKEELETAAAGNGYQHVSVTAIDKLPGGNGVAVYEREFQLEEYGVVGTNDWTATSQICDKSHCLFEIDIPKGVTIKSLVERTIFGEFLTSWPALVAPPKQVKGRLVRFVEQKEKDGQWTQTYQAIPPLDTHD